jgi:hypothetical protein
MIEGVARFDGQGFRKRAQCAGDAERAELVYNSLLARINGK